MACDERPFVIPKPCQSSSSSLNCLFALLAVCFEYACLLEHVYTAKILYLIQNANGRAREVKSFPMALKTLYGLQERGLVSQKHLFYVTCSHSVEPQLGCFNLPGSLSQMCGVFNPTHWTFSLCLTSDMEFSHLSHV